MIEKGGNAVKSSLTNFAHSNWVLATGSTHARPYARPPITGLSIQIWRFGGDSGPMDGDSREFLVFSWQDALFNTFLLMFPYG